MLAGVRADVDAAYGPLGNLTRAIIQAANDTEHEFSPTLGIALEGTPTQQRMLVFYELIYFYAHLTLRYTVRGGLSETQIRKLREFVWPLLASTAVDAFCKHWPDDVKREIQNEFFEKMDNTEVEYSQCAVIWSKEQPFSGTNVFSRLATNIAALLDQDRNPGTMMAVLGAAAHSFEAMHLSNKIAKVAATIDRVRET